MKSSRPPTNVIVAAALLVGIGVRLFIASTGHNFDIDSYEIVARIIADGQNVYASTTRYNYGPVWFWILHWLDVISRLFSNPAQVFRLSVTVFLTFVDIGIFWILCRRYGRDAAIFAFLNGIAILVTGFQGQFDNFAVLVAMLAAWCYETDQTPHPTARLSRRRLAAYALLGVSLMIKHIFFFLPLWLALRERTLRARMWAVVLPLAIFFLGFLPYLRAGREGIANNVFLYRSFSNAPLWNVTARPLLGETVSPMAFFLAALLIAGYVTRRRPAMDAVLIYTVVLVCFAPAITNQYLAIVVPAISVFRNGLFRVYTVLGTFFLLLNRGGLDYPKAYALLAVLLLGGLVWLVIRRPVRNWLTGSENTESSSVSPALLG